jgi:hypothetical protein
LPNLHTDGRRRYSERCLWSVFAAIAYDYTLRHTSAEFAAWMRTLPTEHRETVEGVTLHLLHGSPLAVNDF